jgi:hypothetical protein
VSHANVGDGSVRERDGGGIRDRVGQRRPGRAGSTATAGIAGAPRIESDYGPEFLALDDLPEPAPDLPPLAGEALDRVEESRSAWLRLWREDDSLEDALGTLELIRDPLPTV